MQNVKGAVGEREMGVFRVSFCMRQLKIVHFLKAKESEDIQWIEHSSSSLGQSVAAQVKLKHSKEWKGFGATLWCGKERKGTRADTREAGRGK